MCRVKRSRATVNVQGDALASDKLGFPPMTPTPAPPTVYNTAPRPENGKRAGVRLPQKMAVVSTC